MSISKKITIVAIYGNMNTLPASDTLSDIMLGGSCSISSEDEE